MQKRWQLLRLGLAAVWLGTSGLTSLAGETVGVWITFGHHDEAPTCWEGSLDVASGRLRALRGWHFEEEDRIDGKRWRAQTRREPARRDPESRPMLPSGLVAEIDGNDQTELTLTTSHGKATVRMVELRWGVPIDVLDGAVRLQRAALATTIPVQARAENPEDPELGAGLHVVPRPIPDENVGSSQEDYPAAAVTADGKLWVAWTSYLDRRVDLRIATHEAGGWSPPTVLAPPGDIHQATLAAAGRELWCVWSAQVDGNWDLYARRYDGVRWQEIERLTHDPGADLFPKLSASLSGSFFLAWQATRGRESKILLSHLLPGAARHSNGRDGASAWREAVAVDAGAGNQWFPAVAADLSGGAWVAWDVYQNNSYDVRMAHFSVGSVQPPVIVAGSPRFEANAALTVAPDGSVAVAWEESPPNWGKDFGQLGPDGTTGLYPSREIRVAVYREGRWLVPAREVATAMPPSLRDYLTHPQPLFDGSGRLWIVLRRRNLKYVYPWPRGIWETYLTASDGENGWTPPVYVPGSAGGCAAAPSLARDPRGRLWLAWSTDLRPWRRPIPFQLRVAAARIDPRDAVGTPPALGPRAPEEQPEFPVIHPNESADVARLGAQVWKIKGDQLRLYRGDLHRHTDFSWDATRDGSLLDMYRYALDAAHFDFIASTEHIGWGIADRGNPQYPWWRNEQLCDAFLRPCQFLPMYAYERSMHYPFGHRNILAPRRGVPPVMSFLTPEGSIAPDDTRRLHEELRRSGSLAMAHTSATGMGTDWADNDPEVEPLVEIYQGCRRSYEMPGAPRAAEKPGDYGPGFVSEALAKGYKLGIQSSSDHFSTHMSYTCLYAREFTREALLEAIRLRRAYGATDNILLEFSARDTGGVHLMGEAFRQQGHVVLKARAVGTAPIERAVVIHNGEIVYSIEGDGPALGFEYMPMPAPEDEAFYYVRIEQSDGQLAWSSPIWLESEAE